jgi:hypothetical protein
MAPATTSKSFAKWDQASFGKMARMRLEKYDVVRLVRDNGGGYGNPQF